MACVSDEASRQMAFKNLLKICLDFVFVEMPVEVTIAANWPIWKVMLRTLFCCM